MLGSENWSYQTEAFRDLCLRFDPVLFDPRQVDPSALKDLRTYACLFDLKVEEPTAAALWRRLRPLIAREVAAITGHPPDGGPATFQSKLTIAAHPPSSGPEAPTDAPKLLLLAEDDPEVAVEIRALLAEAGHTVIGPASTAANAAALAAQHPIDLALVDVGLEGQMNGAQLAGQLRSCWGIHCLLLSGDSDNRRHLASEAVLGFVEKPFRSAELLAAVELASALAQRQ